jgi:hypothetical protein
MTITTPAINTPDLLAGSSASAAGAVSGASSAPQRQTVTLRGTRRPHFGHTRLNPAEPWLAPSEVEGSGMSHNKGLTISETAAHS